jgi:hypothetical protein
MSKIEKINLENIRFGLELGYSSCLIKDKMSENNYYEFSRIKNASITPWYHNTSDHNWHVKKNSIILIELPDYKEIFYLLNSKDISREGFIDNSLDVILKKENEFNVNSLRSAYSLMKKDNLLIPVSKNVGGLNRDFYLFKSIIFNLKSIDLMIENNMIKYKNIEIAIGNIHFPSMVYLMDKFSNLNVLAKEPVGKIKGFSPFENYKNYETISELSSQNLITCLNQITKALMLT